jgi:hypothetical protein
MATQFIISDAERTRLYAQIASLESQICTLQELCSPACSDAEKEACLDVNIDVVLVAGGVAVGTTTYFVTTIGASKVEAGRLMVSLGTRSPSNVSFRLIATVGGVDSVLVDSLVEAGFLHSIVDLPTIEANSVLSLETIVDADCPPKGLKVNISGVSCGEVLDDGTCPEPPIHCSVFQTGSTSHCSLFDAI